MPPTRSTRDKATIWLGAFVLLGIIALGWFPRSCPLLQQWLASCPSSRISTPNTPEEIENAHLPHQVIEKDLVEFETNAQEYRKTTEVKFSYRGDLSHQVAHLGIRVNNMVERVALITHPLLYDLTWTRYSTNQPNESMYQREARFGSVAELRASLPPAQELAVDEVIAKAWQLDPRQYQLLEDLTSLDGIQYVVTSYAPPLKDGNWRHYDQTFDTQDAWVDANKKLYWMIFLPDVTGGNEPFRMTTVHIDYRSMR